MRDNGMEEREILEAAGNHPLLKILDPKILTSLIRSSRTVRYRVKRTSSQSQDGR